MIKLTHPDHGIHIAYSDVEVAECKKNGWTEEVKVVKTRKKRVKHDDSGTDNKSPSGASDS